MKYTHFTVNPLGVNCYILWDETTKEAAIIDCGAWYPEEEKEIAHFIQEYDLRPVMALQTHMHFDHIWGLTFLQATYGLSPICHTQDLHTLELQPRMAEMLGLTLPFELPTVERFLEDGDTLQLGNTKIQVIHTPGHSEGCICFYIPSMQILFSGDTLFRESCGRTDFEGGSQADMAKSLERLMLLPENTTVYPGHGPSTTILWEKRHNPMI